MKLPADWPTNVNDATRVQESLRSQVQLVDDWAQPPRFVAGVDVGFEDEGTTTRAAVVVLSFPSLVPADRALARLPTSFPYVPGYLSFREIPAVLAALEQLALTPDLLLVDGHGIAHPRRLGIAAHLGVITGLPALGVGKSLLVGRHEPVPQERGAWTPLVHRGETVGAALCTRPGTKPVFVSPGHRISLATAVHYVMACTTKYRLPETTRHAHHLASNLK